MSAMSHTFIPRLIRSAASTQTGKAMSTKLYEAGSVEMARDAVNRAIHSTMIRAGNQQNCWGEQEHLQRRLQQGIEKRRVMPGMGIPLRFGEQQIMQKA